MNDATIQQFPVCAKCRPNSPRIHGATWEQLTTSLGTMTEKTRCERAATIGGVILDPSNLKPSETMLERDALVNFYFHFMLILCCPWNMCAQALGETSAF